MSSSITKIIGNWISNNELPDSDLLYSTLTDANGLFTSDEGENWDFKDEWPFSLSNDYFIGIVRLICAFSNTNGGIIIFGVHDKKRTGGHNKVNIDFDKFRLSLSQIITNVPNMSLKRYTSKQFNDVDVLMINSRELGISPIRLVKPLGKYTTVPYWIRDGHQVKTASAAHYPVLFCHVDRNLNEEDVIELSGSIPPSPASIGKFVGRTNVLDQLFAWVQYSDDPRSYLYGKGGSGKTTIAWEFSKLVKSYGGKLQIYGNDTFDIVIFVSAKERFFDPSQQKINNDDVLDFSNENELLQKILYYANWITDLTQLQTFDLSNLREEFRTLLDNFSILAIVDDIDTLTTKGINPGSDFVYRTLSRAKRSSKFLYTLRNSPTHSIDSSIEVPGLQGSEYEEFVTECVSHYSVAEPPQSFMNKVLPDISERRPLVIECIIALVRTAGSYERAVDLFNQHAGDNVRDYVFMREWQALSADRYAQLLIVALSELGKPATFLDIETILQIEKSRVRDAIGAASEMFIQLDRTGADTLYSLAPLTSRFIDSIKRTVTGFELINTRAKRFGSDLKISHPRAVNIASKIEKLLPVRVNVHDNSSKMFEANRIITDASLPTLVSEDPLFKCICGYVYSCQIPPKLQDAREAFQYAFSMRFEPKFEYLNQWFKAEFGSHLNDGWDAKVADYIIQGRGYTKSQKIFMLSRKAACIYAMGMSKLYTNPSDALRDFTHALMFNLRAYRQFKIEGEYWAEKSGEYARNTALRVLSIYRQTPSGDFHNFIRFVRNVIEDEQIYIDPIAEVIVGGFIFHINLGNGDAERGKNRRRWLEIEKHLNNKDKWIAQEIRENICGIIYENSK